MNIEDEIIAEVSARDANKIGQGEPRPVPNMPLDNQVGGDHYLGLAIQPLEFSMLNALNACQHTIIKYVVRRKGDQADRLEDIDKAMHTLQIYRKMIADGIAL